MRISTRIRTSVVSVSALMLLCCLLVFYAAEHVRRQQAAITSDALPFIESIEELRYLGTRSLASAMEVAFVESLEVDDDDAAGDEQDEHAENEAEEFEEEAVQPYRELLQRLTEGLSADDVRRAMLDEIARHGNDLTGLGRELIEYTEQDNADPAVMLDMKEAMEDHEDEFVDAINAAIDTQHAKLAAQSSHLEEQLSIAVMLAGIATFLIVIIGSILWFMQDRALVKPLAALEAVARRIGRGELDARVQHEQDDEIGSVARTFNEMAQVLSESISTSYLNNLIESIPDSLLVIDNQQCIKRANRAATKQFGNGSDDQLLGRQLHEVFGLEDASRLVHALNADGATVKLDTFVKSSTDRIPFSVSAAPLGNATINDGEAVVLAKDTSDLHRMLEELQQKSAELERSNRELDQFAYIASHDLKSPLRAIANLSQWIQDDLGDELDDEVCDNIRLLRTRVHRMEALIQGILEYSRIGRDGTEHETVDTGELLRDVVDSLPVPEQFNIDIDAQMPVVHASRVRLSQVFSNLIGNALKYHDRQDGQVRVSVSNGGDRYRFAIADDGPGIAPEYHEKIFQIFQTLAPKDGGKSTGIGLTLVKRIVEDQGGSVIVESESGRGSCFRFDWPREAQQ